jgi:hypothetical protein
MAQQPVWPADEPNVSGKLKTVYTFPGAEELYSSWAFDVKAYLTMLEVQHHLLLDDSAPVPAPDPVDAALLAIRKGNRTAVTAYLFQCCNGEAKVQIARDELIGRPAEIWKELKSEYGLVSSLKAAALRTQMQALSMRQGESIDSLSKRLLTIV